MLDDRQSSNRNYETIYSSKKRKKSNITLSIDTEIANLLKDIAEGEGLSMNSKINSILWKYMTFYKYVEEDNSMIIPSRSVYFFIENISEEKWIQEYIDKLSPFSF